MTAHSNFKALIRARMAETGQNFTSARADLIAERHAEFAARAESALAEHRTVIQRFFDGTRFTTWPAKRRSRAHALLFLVNFFQPDRTYTEPEVNEILGALWSDFAFLRRELVEYGYLERDARGNYWLATQLESRAGTVLHDEAPEWEELWLPDYLAGRAAPVDFAPVSGDAV